VLACRDVVEAQLTRQSHLFAAVANDLARRHFRRVLC
jgi:hypothetical protein